MKKLLFATLFTGIGFGAGLFAHSVLEGIEKAKNARTENSEKVSEPVEQTEEK